MIPAVRRQAMSSVSSIALSGLSAASLRLQVSAGNVANALDQGPLPGSSQSGNYPDAYVPKRVDQVARADGGVDARVRDASPAFVQAYDPSAPYADGSGFVASPNVDLASEIVQQLTAKISFAANAQLVKADHKMTASLLDITA
jgi:flagellar basal-body rod protein FlgC